MQNFPGIALLPPTRTLTCALERTTLVWQRLASLIYFPI